MGIPFADMAQQIELDMAAEFVTDIDSALLSVGRLALLQSFSLVMREHLSLVSFAPLLQCPLLHHLALLDDGGNHGSIPLTDAQVDVIRSFQHLVTLHLDWTPQLLQRVFHAEQPVPLLLLQLESVGDDLSHESREMLFSLSLPHLTTPGPSRNAPPAFQPQS